MNKYLLIILALLIVAIFAFTPKGGIETTSTNHFQNGGISFDYPSNWNMNNGTGSTLATFSDSNGLNVKVLKMGTPPGYDLATRLQSDTAGTLDNSFQLTSQKNTNINGTTAYERDYTVNNKNGTQQRKEVWIQKNNILYGIITTAPNGMNVNLDSLTNSITVNDSSTAAIMRDWARVYFPQFNQEWIFDSYSLNDVNAARHLSSFYPGDKGQMTLLGHHTTHSAPFRYIDQFKPGDKIIIKDYLTQKQYTYEVTSNPKSDIRMGVEAENINYQATASPELWLITCWPPGYARGAYIVHSKLDSIPPLT